jgi:hypothetical protein
MVECNRHLNQPLHVSTGRLIARDVAPNVLPNFMRVKESALVEKLNTNPDARWLSWRIHRTTSMAGSDFTAGRQYVFS